MTDVRLTAIILPTPEPRTAGNGPDESRVIEAIGDDYDTAYLALEGQLPDGWRLASVRRLD